jgi:hypothetical protein
MHNLFHIGADTPKGSRGIQTLKGSRGIQTLEGSRGIQTLEGSRGIQTQKDLTRTAFLVTVKTIEMLKLPERYKRLIPGGIDPEERRKFEQHLPLAGFAPHEQEEAPTTLPPELLHGVILAWIDDTANLPEAERIVDDLRRPPRVAVVKFYSSTDFGEWLQLYGLLAAPRLRVVTNEYRQFDGGCTAAHIVIKMVRDSGLSDVPILIYVKPGLRTTIELGSRLVFLSASALDFVNFARNGTLPHQIWTGRV